MAEGKALVSLERLRLNRARAAQHFSDHRFLIDLADAQVLDRLCDTTRSFSSALNVGAYDGKLSRALLDQKKVQSCLSLEISPELAARAPLPWQVFDGEHLPVEPATADLVVSSLALQFVNDLPLMLFQIAQALKPDGLFLGALLGGETLLDVRLSLMEAELELTGGAASRLMPMADMAALGHLMQQVGFALPVIDREMVRVRYASLSHLVKDLRGMGAGAPFSERNKPLRRDVWSLAERIYASRRSAPSQRLEAEFEIIHLSGWAPHESQPQPCKPGSAKMPLSEGLARSLGNFS